MQKYDVQIDPSNHAFVIRGDFNPEAIAVNLPKEDPERDKYTSYFLHKDDFEKSVNFLMCVSADKPGIINKALFITALNYYLKCFKYSKSRIKIDIDDFCGNGTWQKTDLAYFEALRDRHYMHDENGMTEVTAFLLVNPETDPERTGPASVVWNRVELDYYNESDRLRKLVGWSIINVESIMDIISSSINTRYKNKQRSELLSFGDPHIILASTEKIHEKRQANTQDAR